MNHPLKVLCIDDSATMRAFVRTSLKDDPVSLFWAEDGLTGLAMAWRELPDLILVDMLMPKLSGARLCEVMKSRVETRAIPLYVLTSKSGPVNMEVIALAGADGYLPKPLSKERLRALILALRPSA